MWKLVICAKYCVRRRPLCGQLQQGQCIYQIVNFDLYTAQVSLCCWHIGYCIFAPTRDSSIFVETARRKKSWLNWIIDVACLFAYTKSQKVWSRESSQAHCHSILSTIKLSRAFERNAWCQFDVFLLIGQTQNPQIAAKVICSADIHCGRSYEYHISLQCNLQRFAQVFHLCAFCSPKAYR